MGLPTQPNAVSASREALIDLSGYDGIALPPYLRELTATPILLDNDANVIVLSERRGQRDRFDDMLLIKASTGLCAGIDHRRRAPTRSGRRRRRIRAHQDCGRRQSPADAATPGASRR